MSSVSFKEFGYRKPEEAKSPESPFFLAIRHRRKPEDKIQFVNSPTHGKEQNWPVPFQRYEKFGNVYTRGKFTNHSVRKTCIKTLLDLGVSHNNVAQPSGYKSLKVIPQFCIAHSYCARFLPHERARVQSVIEFPQTKLDSEINAAFLLNEPCDPHFLFYKFNDNNILNK